MTVEIQEGAPRAFGAPLQRLVHTLHERTIEPGLAELGLAGLDRVALEAVLTYCAEQRCIADKAACPGCTLATQAQGITSLDDLVRRVEVVGVGDGSIEIRAPGAGRLTVDSLEALARTWAGEEYWFWARRVLRKLRHGIRSKERPALPGGPEAAPVVVLVEPQLPDNIGMVARAMANFGLESLRLVAPRDGWPNEKARIAASGANFIIDDAVAVEDWSAALADLNWVCATTARQRDLRKPVLTPEQAVAEMRSRIGAGERCGIVFGRERNGLTTDEIADADAIVMIPVDPRFASLNLAQATLLLGYEWLKAQGTASLGRVTTYETPLTTGLNLGDERPASKEQLIGLFTHIEDELDRLGFFNPPHKRQTVVRNLRTMLTRMGATEQEVRTLRGIVATLARGKGVGRKSP